jgi:integrase
MTTSSAKSRIEAVRSIEVLIDAIANTTPRADLLRQRVTLVEKRIAAARENWDIDDNGRRMMHDKLRTAVAAAEDRMRARQAQDATASSSTSLTTFSADASARKYRAASKSSSTQRSYRSAVAADAVDDSPNGRRRAASRKFAPWSTWASAHGTPALPAAPDAIAAYLAELADAGASPATLAQRRAAIAFTHRAANLPDPTGAENVLAVIHGVARSTTRTKRRAAPMLLEDLERAVQVLVNEHAAAAPGSAAALRALRDRALLVMGWVGAFRRSELAALAVEDVQRRTVKGRPALLVTVRRSKTDQQGDGKTKVMPSASAHPLADPVAAYRAWVAAARITAGPVFRAVDRHGNVKPNAVQGQDVADVVARVVKVAGLDPRITAHGMRAGLITQGAIAGASALGLRAQSGHESDTAFAGYIRSAGAVAVDAVLAAMGE